MKDALSSVEFGCFPKISNVIVTDENVQLFPFKTEND